MRKKFDLSPDAAFWILVTGLLSCALFFFINVELRRGGFSTFTGKADIAQNEGVTLHRVLDGDEVSLTRKGGETFVLRLLGVKCFEPSVAEPGIGSAGVACAKSLEKMLTEESHGPITVVYEGTLKHDAQDRVLAYLHVGSHDVGLDLVKEGRGIVFTRFPFSREQAYLAEQVTARQADRGLWANDRARERADALRGQWAGQRGAP